MSGRWRSGWRVVGAATVLVTLVAGCAPSAEPEIDDTIAGDEGTELPLIPAEELAAMEAAAARATARAASVSLPAAGQLGTTTVAGIPSDCSTDVSDALAGFIAAVPDGWTIRFPAGACYLVDRTLLLMDRNGLVFEGNGATLRQRTDGSGVAPLPSPFHRIWPRQRAMWLSEGGSALVWRNLRVEGPSTACRYGGQRTEEQAAWHVNGTIGAVIEDSAASGVLGDFVAVQGEISRAPAQQVLVRRNRFDCAGRMGVAIVNATDVVVEDNVIERTGRSMFDIEPPAPTWQAQRITIRRNRVAGFNGVFLANLGNSGRVHDISVTDNVSAGTVTVAARGSASGERRSRYTIARNVGAGVVGSPQAVFRFANIDDVVVEDNAQVVSGYLHKVYSGHGVALVGSRGAVVRRNRFPERRGPKKTRGVKVVVADASSGPVARCGNVARPDSPPVDGVC